MGAQLFKDIGIPMPGFNPNVNTIKDRACYGTATYRNPNYGGELADVIRTQAIYIWIFGWIPLVGNIIMYFILNTLGFAISTMDKWLICQAVWGNTTYNMDYYEQVWSPWYKDLSRYAEGGYSTQLMPLFSNVFNMVLG